MTPNKWLKFILGAAAAGAGAAAVYTWIIRPWHLRWGTQGGEASAPLPGDDLLANPMLCATHAITINAKPAQVWPWLAQLGQGRGGFYSYDVLENLMGLDIHTANQILPQYQHIQPGDLVPLSPDGFGFPVAIAEPNRALVLHGDTREDKNPALPVGKDDYLAATWGFYLFETGCCCTRLVERWKASWTPSIQNTLFYRLFLEPGAFIMEHRMLQGIKARAEGLAAAEPCCQK